MSSHFLNSPDGISSYLLKACAEELSPVWCSIFQRSIDSKAVPAIWKKSLIVPVPKNNDFRPIALTSIVMKWFEECMVSMLKADVNNHLDPLQFAYNVEEWVMLLIPWCIWFLITWMITMLMLDCFLLILVHLLTLFNHVLMKKINQLGVNAVIIQRYYSFLSDRTQSQSKR